MEMFVQFHCLPVRIETTGFSTLHIMDSFLGRHEKIGMQKAGAPNGNFRENICSEDDLRSRIFGAFVVKFLACLPLLRFSNIYKMV